MITRCVTACVVSGALASAMTSGSPLGAPGHATVVVKEKDGGSRAPHLSQCPIMPVGQELSTAAASLQRSAAACAKVKHQSLQTEALPVGEHSSPPLRKTVARSPAPALRPQRALHPPRRRHLGKFKMTAYTHYHHPPRRTASGKLPTVGRTVAVDPRVIPLGARIYIEGVGMRVAEDTGRRIKGKKLDLFLPSIQSALRFGARARDVYIVD